MGLSAGGGARFSGGVCVVIVDVPSASITRQCHPADLNLANPDPKPQPNPAGNKSNPPQPTGVRHHSAASESRRCTGGSPPHHTASQKRSRYNMFCLRQSVCSHRVSATSPSTTFCKGRGRSVSRCCVCVVCYRQQFLLYALDDCVHVG